MSSMTGARSKRTVRIGVLLALQVLFLLGLAGSYYATGWFGKEIRLQTAPVDPRDLFYGDYVRLSYDISRIPVSKWTGEEPIQAENYPVGKKVYVLLQPGADGVYEVKSASYDKLQAAGEETVLEGRLEWVSSLQAAVEAVVEYGLERYYVPEGTGRELEDQARNMIVRVQVAPWGQKKISGYEWK
ncbi:GDYXXLXY domain-containing protein [Paenibacillus sp. y28]|uniref:GDYXXLXY domain-containing protein n=1 Tax=Paenibacillus sp. y28 TaxID=3129110 RepID=UPI00301AB46B